MTFRDKQERKSRWYAPVYIYIDPLSCNPFGVVEFNIALRFQIFKCVTRGANICTEHSDYRIVGFNAPQQFRSFYTILQFFTSVLFHNLLAKCFVL